MSKDTGEVLYRVLPFSGKQEDWYTWQNKFIAIAQAKGYCLTEMTCRTMKQRSWTKVWRPTN
jgi:hypothetical protein